jgi:hypothetical protein
VASTDQIGFGGIRTAEKCAYISERSTLCAYVSGNKNAGPTNMTMKSCIDAIASRISMVYHNIQQMS